MSRQEFAIYLAVAVVVFLLGIGAGYAVMASGDPAAEQLIEMVKEGVFAGILDDTPAMIALKIFLNNLQACLVLFLGGATFGILTLFILISNGVVIGVFAGEILDRVGLSGLALGLIPHGIFELPALFISAALGLSLARSLLAELSGMGDAAADAARMGGLFLRIVVPLLALAAVIEAFITPALLQIVV
ncbi:stage II sporulation protein M [Methanofollis fontis]|uniref:Stage II sporulation protein M n=1 Tax=Methanofollis fontis TaxID=2052832 RepID=A0A483CXY0_9EURY|nr:stage II sporulation protein M [Methanofollis fontis]TAJ44879.1 stage II sporulation protein M [Methanofollis fontis]